MLDKLDPFDPRTWEDEPDKEYRIWATNADISVLLDFSSYVVLSRHTWNCFRTIANKVYFRRSVWCKEIRQNKTILLHRVVLEVAGVPLPDLEQRYVAAHRDGNELDCRLRNLRWATYLENGRNRRA